jgi:hypothetical protein
MSIHLNLDKDEHTKIQAYADKHTKGNKSATVKLALKKLFADEMPQDNSEQGKILDFVIRKLFNLPAGHTARGFYAILYLLAVRYPQASAKLFWSEVIFIGLNDVTHKEVFDEIVAAQRFLLNAKGKLKDAAIPK